MEVFPGLHMCAYMVCTHVHIYYICTCLNAVCVLVYVFAIAHVWMSKDNLWGLALIFHYVCQEIKHKLLNMMAIVFPSWAILLASKVFNLFKLKIY